MTLNGITITNVEGEGCGTCTIAEALKRSLNTSYYRLMLKLKNGPADVADAAHRAASPTVFPGSHTPVRGRQGRPPTTGGARPVPNSRDRYGVRVCNARGFGVYHKPHFVQKVVNAQGEVLFDAGTQDNAGRAAHRQGGRRQRDRGDAADRRVVQRSQPGGWQAVGIKTGTNQLGDTGANRDAWMVGTPLAVHGGVGGHRRRNQPLVNKWGGPVYGSGIPADIWKATMDGALQGTNVESFPTPTEVGGYAGVPRAAAAVHDDTDRYPATPDRDGDPAEHRDRARHHHSYRSPTTVPIRTDAGGSPTRPRPARRCRHPG